MAYLIGSTGAVNTDVSVPTSPVASTVTGYFDDAGIVRVAALVPVALVMRVPSASWAVRVKLWSEGQSSWVSSTVTSCHGGEMLYGMVSIFSSYHLGEIEQLQVKSRGRIVTG